MNSILNKLGDSLLSTKLDFIYVFLSSMTDKGTEQIVELIKNKIGLDISNSNILENLNDDQVNEIRQCVYENLVPITDLYLANKQLDVTNTINARDMYLKTITANKESKFLAYFPAIFGGTMAFLTMVYIFAITFLPIPTNNQRYVDVVIGFLVGGILSAIVGYYFGSSNSSARAQTNSTKRPPISVSTSGTNVTENITARCDVSEDDNVRLPKE